MTRKESQWTYPKRSKRKPPIYVVAVIGGVALGILTRETLKLNLTITFIGWTTFLFSILQLWYWTGSYVKMTLALRWQAHHNKDVYHTKLRIGLRWIVEFIAFTSIPVLLPDTLGVLYQQFISFVLGLVVAAILGRDFIWIIWLTKNEQIKMGTHQMYTLWFLTFTITAGAMWHISIFMTAPQIHLSSSLTEKTSAIFACMISTIIFSIGTLRALSVI